MRQPALWRTLVPGLALALTVAGCGDKPAEPGGAATKRQGPPPTLISVAKAETRALEIIEETVGTLEDLLDPRISAEVAGRVVQVNVAVGSRVRRGQVLAEIDQVDIEIQGRSDQAEVARLEVLLANQERVVERNMKLVDSNFISRNALDDSIAQRNALREQLVAAKTRKEASGSALRKTRVLSPIDGQVEEQIVRGGDYVKVGDPLFKLVGAQKMRAHLPFPESAAPRLKIGAPVTLSSPLMPGKMLRAKITEIRPTVVQASRALDVIVAFDNDGSFRGGGTVNASVVVAVKSAAVTVPEQSVVLRPAGKVVYLVVEGKVQQQIVETGYKRDGLIEVTSGLSGGEVVALDGAGFLTHGAPIQLAGARGGAGKGAGKSAGKGTAKGPGEDSAASTAGKAPAGDAAKSGAAGASGKADRGS